MRNQTHIYQKYQKKYFFFQKSFFDFLYWRSTKKRKDFLSIQGPSSVLLSGEKQMYFNSVNTFSPFEQEKMSFDEYWKSSEQKTIENTLKISTKFTSFKQSAYSSSRISGGPKSREVLSVDKKSISRGQKNTKSFATSKKSLQCLTNQKFHLLFLKKRKEKMFNKQNKNLKNKSFLPINSSFEISQNLDFFKSQKIGEFFPKKKNFQQYWLFPFLGVFFFFSQNALVLFLQKERKFQNNFSFQPFQIMKTVQGSTFLPEQTSSSMNITPQKKNFQKSEENKIQSFEYSFPQKNFTETQFFQNLEKREYDEFLKFYTKIFQNTLFASEMGSFAEKPNFFFLRHLWVHPSPSAFSASAWTKSSAKRVLSTMSTQMSVSPSGQSSESFHPLRGKKLEAKRNCFSWKWFSVNSNFLNNPQSILSLSSLIPQKAEFFVKKTFVFSQDDSLQKRNFIQKPSTPLFDYSKNLFLVDELKRDLSFLSIKNIEFDDKKKTFPFFKTREMQKFFQNQAFLKLQQKQEFFSSFSPGQISTSHPFLQNSFQPNNSHEEKNIFFLQKWLKTQKFSAPRSPFTTGGDKKKQSLVGNLGEGNQQKGSNLSVQKNEPQRPSRFCLQNRKVDDYREEKSGYFLPGINFDVQRKNHPSEYGKPQIHSFLVKTEIQNFYKAKNSKISQKLMNLDTLYFQKLFKNVSLLLCKEDGGQKLQKQFSLENIQNEQKHNTLEKRLQKFFNFKKHTFGFFTFQHYNKNYKKFLYSFLSHGGTQNQKLKTSSFLSFNTKYETKKAVFFLQSLKKKEQQSFFDLLYEEKNVLSHRDVQPEKNEQALFLNKSILSKNLQNTLLFKFHHPIVFQFFQPEKSLQKFDTKSFLKFSEKPFSLYNQGNEIMKLKANTNLYPHNFSSQNFRGLPVGVEKQVWTGRPLLHNVDGCPGGFSRLCRHREADSSFSQFEQKKAKDFLFFNLENSQNQNFSFQFSKFNFIEKFQENFYLSQNLNNFFSNIYKFQSFQKNFLIETSKLQKPFVFQHFDVVEHTRQHTNLHRCSQEQGHASAPAIAHPRFCVDADGCGWVQMDVDKSRNVDVHKDAEVEKWGQKSVNVYGEKKNESHEHKNFVMTSRFFILKSKKRFSFLQYENENKAIQSNFLGFSKKQRKFEKTFQAFFSPLKHAKNHFSVSTLYGTKQKEKIFTKKKKDFYFLQSLSLLLKKNPQNFSFYTLTSKKVLKTSKHENQNLSPFVHKKQTKVVNSLKNSHSREKNRLSPQLLLKRDGFLFFSTEQNQSKEKTNFHFQRLEKEKSFQKKRRLKKEKLETRRRKKRKRFFPRPVWLRMNLYKKFLKTRHSQKLFSFSSLSLKHQKVSYRAVDEKKLNTLSPTFLRGSKKEKWFQNTEKKQLKKYFSKKFCPLRGKKTTLTSQPTKTSSDFQNYDVDSLFFKKQNSTFQRKTYQKNSLFPFRLFLTKKDARFSAFSAKQMSASPHPLGRSHLRPSVHPQSGEAVKWTGQSPGGCKGGCGWMSWRMGVQPDGGLCSGGVQSSGSKVSKNIDHYKISNDIYQEFLRLSWKSSWFQNNFKPYTRTIQENFQKIQSIESQKSFSNFFDIFILPQGTNSLFFFKDSPVFSEQSRNNFLVRKSVLQKFSWYSNVENTFSSHSILNFPKSTASFLESFPYGSKNVFSSRSESLHFSEYNRLLYARISDILKKLKFSENMTNDSFFESLKVNRRKSEKNYSALRSSPKNSFFTKTALFFEKFQVPSQPVIPAFSVFSSLFHDSSLKPTGDIPTLRAMWAFQKTNFSQFQERNSIQNLWAFKKRKDSFHSFKGTKKIMNFFRTYNAFEKFKTPQQFSSDWSSFVIPKYKRKNTFFDNGLVFSSPNRKKEFSFAGILKNQKKNDFVKISKDGIDSFTVKTSFLASKKGDFFSSPAFLNTLDTMTLKKFQNIEKKSFVFGIQSFKQNSKISYRYFKFHFSPFYKNQKKLSAFVLKKEIQLLPLFSPKLLKNKNPQNSAKSSLNFWWAQKPFQNFDFLGTSQFRTLQDFSNIKIFSFDFVQKDNSFFNRIDSQSKEKFTNIQTLQHDFVFSNISFLLFGSFFFHFAIFYTLFKIPEIRSVFKFTFLIFSKFWNSFFVVFFSIYNIFKKYTKNGFNLLKRSSSFSENKTIFPFLQSHQQNQGGKKSSLPLLRHGKMAFQNYVFQNSLSPQGRSKNPNSFYRPKLNDFVFEFFPRFSFFSLSHQKFFPNLKPFSISEKNERYFFQISNSFSTVHGEKKIFYFQSSFGSQKNFKQIFSQTKILKNFDSSFLFKTFQNEFLSSKIFPQILFSQHSQFQNSDTHSISPFLQGKIEKLTNWDNPPQRQSPGGNTDIRAKQKLSKTEKNLSQFALSFLVFGKNILFVPYNIFKFGSSLFTKIFEIVEGIFYAFYKFLEKPAEFMVEFIAFVFLIEWSSDILGFFPDSIETSMWKSSQKLLRPVRTGTFFLSFGIFFLRSGVGTSSKIFSKDSPFLFQTVQNFSLSQSGFSPFQFLFSTGFFQFTNFATYVLQKRLFYVFENVPSILLQPDIDILVRQRKGIIFWDIWAEILLKAAEKYNVNLPSFVTLKEEQELFIEKLVRDSQFFESFDPQRSQKTSTVVQLGPPAQSPPSFLLAGKDKKRQNPVRRGERKGFSAFLKGKSNHENSGIRDINFISQKTSENSIHESQQNSAKSFSSFLQNFVIQNRPARFFDFYFLSQNDSFFQKEKNIQKLQQFSISNLFSDGLGLKTPRKNKKFSVPATRMTESRATRMTKSSAFAPAFAPAGTLSSPLLPFSTFPLLHFTASQTDGRMDGWTQMTLSSPLLRLCTRSADANDKIQADGWTQMTLFRQKQTSPPFFDKKRKNLGGWMSELSATQFFPLLGPESQNFHFLRAYRNIGKKVSVQDSFYSFQNIQKVDRWECNQYATFQSQETDFFLDIYPPKSLKHVHFLKYYEPAHYTLGSLICQIYAGVFPKQVSKNILVVGESGTAKTFFLRALAGETEMKIITENASRYAVVQRGVAVGMKYLRDVFDAIALQTPCFFVMEDLHIIGSKRPFMISENENTQNVQSSFGLEQQEVHETNQMIYQSSRHSISDFRRPYKGDFSLGIPTNYFLQTFYSPFFSSHGNQNTNKNFSSLHSQRGWGPFDGGQDSFSFPLRKGHQFQNSQFFGGNFSSSVWNSLSSPLPIDSLEVALQNTGIQEKEKSNFESFSAKKNAKKIQSLLQFSKEQIFAPPATSPFTVLMMKEQKKLKPKKIVQETSWGGLSADQILLYQKESSSIRAKIAVLAEKTLNLSRGKFDMITDFLVIIDSVRSNRGFVVFGTTHKPSFLDPALRRPGRFDETLSLSRTPNFLNRFEIFKMNLENSVSTFDFFDSSILTENFSEMDLFDILSQTKLSFFHNYKYGFQKSLSFNMLQPIRQAHSSVAQGQKSERNHIKSSEKIFVKKQLYSQTSPAKAFHALLKSPLFEDFYTQKQFTLFSSQSAKSENFLKNSKFALRNSNVFFDQRYTLLPKGPSHMLSLAYSKLGVFLSESNLLYDPTSFVPLKLDINKNSSRSSHFQQYYANVFFDPVPHFSTLQANGKKIQKNSQLMVFLSGKVAEFFICPPPFYPSAKRRSGDKKRQSLGDADQKNLSFSNSGTELFSSSMFQLSEQNFSPRFARKNFSVFEKPFSLFSEKFGIFESSFENVSALNKKSINSTFLKKSFFSPTRKSKMNISQVQKSSLLGKKDFYWTIYGNEESWRSATPFLSTIIQKRFLFTKNLLLSKMLFFENMDQRRKPPNPPGSSILMFSKKYENFKRTEADFFQKAHFSIHEKIQMHQKQKFLKQLYNVPVETYFRSELRKNHKTLFSSSFQEFAYLDSFVQKSSSSHSYYKKYIQVRHRFSNLNQWWNGMFPEHTRETTYLSDVDWRTMFVSSLKSEKTNSQINVQKKIENSKKSSLETFEFLMDFPDAEQYYNPRNHRWFFKSNFQFVEKVSTTSSFWSIFEKDLQYEIFSHYLMESFYQSFSYFEKRREMLDFFAFHLLYKGFLKEFDFLTTFSRFEK
jgi:SpoVK/Ycf46/Vps4 family AAA+-type ATPase